MTEQEQKMANFFTECRFIQVDLCNWENERPEECSIKNQWQRFVELTELAQQNGIDKNFAVMEYSKLITTKFLSLAPQVVLSV